MFEQAAGGVNARGERLRNQDIATGKQDVSPAKQHVPTSKPNGEDASFAKLRAARGDGFSGGANSIQAAAARRRQNGAAWADGADIDAAAEMQRGD